MDDIDTLFNKHFTDDHAIVPTFLIANGNHHPRSRRYIDSIGHTAVARNAKRMELNQPILKSIPARMIFYFYPVDPRRPVAPMMTLSMLTWIDQAFGRAELAIIEVRIFLYFVEILLPRQRRRRVSTHIFTYPHTVDVRCAGTRYGSS